MTILNFDLTVTAGKIKVLNAMNNGPVGSGVRGGGNFEAYKNLEIPYARYHDSSFCTSYGGEHSVDVHRIFKNFDADENDPANYVFEPTDKYVKATYEAGTKVFYRLGASIEHDYKVGTYPPKDFAKWARICEHIIRHYNEGWANGFNYGIEYWEIWNEPDLLYTDKPSPCWQGTEDQFVDLYEVAAKHLKTTFPQLKIGGPAFCSIFFNISNPENLKAKFFKAVKERNIPLDFFSFHGYLYDPGKVFMISNKVVELFNSYELPLPELIYNEWNYVRDWVGKAYRKSRNDSRGIKGASFNTAVICATQESAIDMLMYYDARPSDWCGLFTPYDYDLLKPYYGYYLFKDIPKLGAYVPAKANVGNIWSIAATDGKSSAIMLTHFNDNDETPTESVTVNVKTKGKTKLEYYLLDESKNGELVKKETFDQTEFEISMDMKLFDTYLLKFTEI